MVNKYKGYIFGSMRGIQRSDGSHVKQIQRSTEYFDLVLHKYK